MPIAATAGPSSLDPELSPVFAVLSVIHVSTPSLAALEEIWAEREPIRRSVGCTGWRLLQDLQQPSHAWLLLEWADESAAREYCESDALRFALEAADVTVLGVHYLGAPRQKAGPILVDPES